MIDAIRIGNFKIFKDAELELHPLTVLTGFNSGGKSTVLQSLLLASLGLRSRVVSLNGPYGLALGEGFDVLNLGASEAEVRFTLRAGEQQEEVVLTIPDDRAVNLPCRVSSELQQERFSFEIGNYLSAERLGPRDLLEVVSTGESNTGVGDQGQYTAHVLAQNERMRVNSTLLHPTASTSITLSGQVEAWLSDMVRPVRVQATWLPSTSAAMIRFQEAVSGTDSKDDVPQTEISGNWTRPANVGFGLSYALPIIVAGLCTKPEETLIVENPEAHLHPAGQSKMGHFLTLVAASGVQTIIETHSEHIVDGIRLGIAKFNALPPESAIFHFFGETSISTMSVSATGAISKWPSGFFDQSEEDLAQLSRIRRSS